MSIFQGFLRKAPKPKPFNLDNLRVALPCPAEWSNMVGGDRVRHCAECKLKVYNLSAMTEQQVQQLLTVNRGQRLCGRFYRRADGTVLTQDCPWSLRVAVRKVSRIGTAVLTAILSANFAMAKNKPKLTNCECQQTAQRDSGLQITVADQQSALITNAQVTMEKSAKEKTTGSTGLAGGWSQPKLAPGKYTLIVEAQGFQTFKGKVEVRDRMLLNLKIKLPVAAVITTVKVEGGPAVVMGEIGLVMIEHPAEDPYPDRFTVSAKQSLRL